MPFQSVNTIVMLMTFVAFVLAIGLHNGMEGVIATVLGDTSLAREGKLTFNPLRHMTPFGTVVAVITSFTFTLPGGLGWGRLVRPDARRLRIGPNAGLVILALSGILTYFVVGLLIALVFSRFLLSAHDLATLVLCIDSGTKGGPLQGCLAAWQPGWLLRAEQFVYIFGYVNLILGFLNLIPLYPLDGYHILFAFLPTNAAISFRNGEQWHELILAGIFFLLPLLLSLGQLPVQFTPLGLLQSASLNIISSLADHGLPGAYNLFFNL